MAAILTEYCTGGWIPNADNWESMPIIWAASCIKTKSVISSTQFDSGSPNKSNNCCFRSKHH